MTLRDALLADVERRGVRRKTFADGSLIRIRDEWGFEARGNRVRWVKTFLMPSDVLADDWEVAT